MNEYLNPNFNVIKMTNKIISINEPNENLCQQTVNLSHLFINYKNKEYEENNLDIERNNIDFNCIKKSSDFAPYLDSINFNLNQSNSLINLGEYSNVFIPEIPHEPKISILIKNEKEEVKEDEREDQKEEEKSDYAKKNKIMGRKRKNSEIKGKHNKYSNDNIFRKIKSNLLHILYKFINEKLIHKYKVNQKYNLKRNILRKIEQVEVVNSDIKFNKIFLNKELKDIFSVNVSSKYKCKKDHNKIIIDKLFKEEGNEKIELKNIFNLTFCECLKHFRGSTFIPELNGMITFKQYKEKFLNDKDYLESFDYLIMNYEKILSDKKPRKKRK